MLIPFTAQYRLVAVLDRLALYNDKGIAWSRHDAQRAQLEKQKMVGKIEGLVAKIGESVVPADFLRALRSGEVANDLTGKYAGLVKDHFTQ